MSHRKAIVQTFTRDLEAICLEALKDKKFDQVPILEIIQYIFEGLMLKVLTMSLQQSALPQSGAQQAAQQEFKQQTNTDIPVKDNVLQFPATKKTTVH